MTEGGGESPDQLIELIRFGLVDLSTRNAHFDFEELCRHLARSCICTNIVPATGPVAVGGDQGRDFETFRHRAPGELGPPWRLDHRRRAPTTILTVGVRRGHPLYGSDP